MKRTMKRGLLTLAVAGFVGASALGVSSVVSLAEGEEKIFDYGFLNGRTYITGVTQENIENAFEKEAKRVKDEMTEQGIADQFVVVNAPLGNGWPSANDTYFVAAHMDLGSYSGWNNWGKTGYAFIVYNPHMDEAFTVRGEAAAAYVNMNNGWTDQVTIAGYPKGNDFTVGETTYQNFTLGYSMGSQFIAGKNVDETGKEIALTAEDIAENMVVPVYQDTASAEVIEGLSIEDFVNAYKEYYTDKEVNYNPMRNINNLNNSQWRQKTADGGEVVYNSLRKEMFTIKTFLSAYNATTEWGNPVGEETTTKGVVNQLFTKGVAVLEGEEVKFYVASHVDPDTGEIVSDFNEDAVGNMTDDVAASLPSGVTADAVAEAAKAVWTTEMGNPADYMNFETETILSQTFVAKETVDGKDVNKTSKIYVDVSKTPLTAVVLDSDTYEIYKLPVRFNEGNKKYDVTGEMVLGPATSAVFEANGKKYQNFLYGAIELSAAKEEDMVLPGVNYDASGNRTVLDLSGFITIDASTIRIPESYNIGAADLLAKFKAAYKEFTEQGIALGMPNKEGIGAWPATEGGQEDGTNEFKDGQGMIKLGLHATDSNAICYYGVTAMLAYNPEDGNVYLMSDAVMSNMATYYSVYGAPRGNLTATTITVDGQEIEIQIQNFQLGYLTVMGDAASMVADRNWDFELGGAVNLDGSKIPGVEYPGEKDDDGDSSSGGSGSSENESDGGCGSTMSLVAASSALLVAGVVLVIAKKRKING